MSVKDELQIILITYNRRDALKKTLENLSSDTCPIKDYDITILDNCSTDGTGEFCEEFVKQHCNFKHIQNKINVGISGNIIKAMEMASKKWLWMLADDDNFDWTNWDEIENALLSDKYDIVHTTYTEGMRNETTPYLLNEEVFLPTPIYKTELIDYLVMQNAYGVAYTFCPHHAIDCKVINQNGKIYVPHTRIVLQTYNDKCNLVRASKKGLYHRFDKFQLLAGYISSYQLIEDEKIRHECCDVLCLGQTFKNSMGWFLEENNGYSYNIFDILLGTSKRQQKDLIMELFKKDDSNLKTFMQFINYWNRLIMFEQIKNFFKLFYITKTKTHRTFHILGIKIRLKRKQRGI